MIIGRDGTQEAHLYVWDTDTMSWQVWDGTVEVGGAAQIDRSAFTDGSGSITPIGGVFNETNTEPTEDQAAAVRITAQRAIHVNLRDASGTELAVGGGTQYTEDAASAGAEKLTLAGAVRRDTAASSSTTDGDYSTLNTTSTGRLWTSAVIDTALPAGTNAIGKLAANSGVDIGDVDVTSLPALAAGTNNIGDVDVLTVPVDPFGVNADAASATGSISAKLRFIASTGIPVTGTVTVGSHAVTNAGTFAVQDSEKLADDAAFTVATTKVSPVGYLADETATDSVDEGDIGAARMTLDRKQQVVTEIESNSMRSSGVAVTPKFAAISASSNGDNTIVAAVGGKKIRVLQWSLMASGTVNAKWQSAAGGTDKTGLYYFVANTGVSVPFAPTGLFETVSGELLNLNLSAGTAVGGSIVYIEV